MVALKLGQRRKRETRSRTSRGRVWYGQSTSCSYTRTITSPDVSTELSDDTRKHAACRPLLASPAYWISSVLRHAYVLEEGESRWTRDELSKVAFTSHSNAFWPFSISCSQVRATKGLARVCETLGHYLFRRQRTVPSPSVKYFPPRMRYLDLDATLLPHDLRRIHGGEIV